MTRRKRISGTPWSATLAMAAAVAVGVEDVGAQERLPGVELGLVYESDYQPALAVKPFGGRFGGAGAARDVQDIIARDLRYSDRFTLMDSIPAALQGQGIDYTLWDRLGAVWLLNGSVEGTGTQGFIVVLELHDVLYGQVKEEGRFPIPDPSDPGFRMAVHEISDQIVRWTFDEPGMAASRIAFSMTQDGGQTQELWLIDSDGENLRRVTNYGTLTMMPAWAPDGENLLYTSYKSGFPRIYELDLATGQEASLDLLRDGDFITPAYHPDGDLIAFSVQAGALSGIYTYNLTRQCCLTNLSQSQHREYSPTFSPDGRWMAFNSNRFGDNSPQVFFMPAGGGEADLISPYRYGEHSYYTAPEWSPYDDLVAFSGRVGLRGPHQILVARMGEDGRVLQLTSEGNNEDPSWAPDGRHLVFIGERTWGRGLFVVDSHTGAIRPLLRGVAVRVPEWSPSLGRTGM